MNYIRDKEVKTKLLQNDQSNVLVPFSSFNL